jgi:hypothetical protein
MFHDIRERFGGPSFSAALIAGALRPCRDERGRFLPTALMWPCLWHPCRDFAIVPAPLPLSLELQPGRTSCSAQGWYGSENAEAAEVTVHAVS